ncbi:MAG: PocR ligand-binding domain-containing protein [Spirochaetes bacterium]|nr:PocR ligand-binding domain-containing protein [Spirochaetota bacterium]
MAKKQENGLWLSEELGDLLDHFAAAFGVRIAFFSPDGRESRAGLSQGSISFCTLLRQNPSQENACRSQDRAMIRVAAAGGKRVDYHCHAGLRESLQPVYGDDRALLGFLMVGQFRTPTDSLAAKGLSPAARRELSKAFEGVPTIPAERLPHLLAFFSLIVQTTASRRLVERRADALVWRIERYAREHLDQPLSLTQAALLVGRSASTVSHVFKKRTGTPFKQRLLALRIEKAEDLLRQNPAMKVSEAARAVGYENPFLFSRLFKKHRGVAPAAVKGLRAHGAASRG